MKFLLFLALAMLLIATAYLYYLDRVPCPAPDLVICAEPRSDETQCWVPGRQWVCTDRCREVTEPWPRVEGWTVRRLP